MACEQNRPDGDPATSAAETWQPGDPLHPATPPPAPKPLDRRVDLEHLPAQRMSAAGDVAAAQWVYDAAAEIERLRGEVAELRPIRDRARTVYGDGTKGPGEPSPRQSVETARWILGEDGQ